MNAVRVIVHMSAPLRMAALLRFLRRQGFEIQYKDGDLIARHKDRKEDASA